MGFLWIVLLVTIFDYFREWPTIPQLFVDREFVGGFHVVLEVGGMCSIYFTLTLE